MTTTLQGSKATFVFCQIVSAFIVSELIIIAVLYIVSNVEIDLEIEVSGTPIKPTSTSCVPQNIILVIA